MIRCSICLESEDAIGTLTTCGHVFCIDCLDEQFKHSPQCPKCRQPSNPSKILRIYPDGDPPPPRVDEQPRQHTLSEAAKYLPRAEHAIRRCSELNAESSEEEIRSVVGEAEMLLVQVESDFEPYFKNVLERISDTLQALRNRLKYAHQLAAVKQEQRDTMAQLQKREQQVHDLICDRVRAEQDAYAAQKETERLTIQDQKWREKYQRLKTKFTIQEHKHATNHRLHAQKLEDAKKQLGAQNLRALKYKKKLVAFRQQIPKLKATPQTSTLVRQNAFIVPPQEDDIDIVDMPGAFPSPLHLLGKKASTSSLASASTACSSSSPKDGECPITPTDEYDIGMGDFDFEMSDDEDMPEELDVFGVEPASSPTLLTKFASTSRSPNFGDSSRAGPSIVRTPPRSAIFSKEDVFFSDSSFTMRTPEKIGSRSERASRLVREVRQQGVREGWIPRDWENRLSDYGYAS